jgi:phospholipase C
MQQRITSILLLCFLSLNGMLLLSLNGCGGSSTGTKQAASGPLEHVVVIFQENRTPDNLFHGLPNADIANSGMNSLGQTIVLQPIALANHYDLGHAHRDFVAMYDNGKIDGADKVKACAPGAPGCPPNPQFQYVDPSDVAPYFQLAEQYTFGDRMFQTNQGPSFPAHQFIISGTSAPTATSNLFAAENANNGITLTGCISPPTCC